MIVLHFYYPSDWRGWVVRLLGQTGFTHVGLEIPEQEATFLVPFFGTGKWFQAGPTRALHPPDAVATLSLPRPVDFPRFYRATEAQWKPQWVRSWLNRWFPRWFPRRPNNCITVAQDILTIGGLSPQGRTPDEFYRWAMAHQSGDT